MPDNHNLNYNYGFNSGNGGNGGSNRRNNNDSDLIYWIITIAAFVACWPIGLFLLFRKLNEGGRSSPKKQVQRQTQRQPQREAARPAAPQNPRAKLKAHPGRGFLFSGACAAGLFGFCTLMQFLDTFPYAGLFGALQECAPLFFLTGIGAALMMWGNKLNRQNREFRKLLSMVGNRNAVDLESLAGAAGVSYDHVAETLQDMIDARLFGDYAFLDLAAGRLVLNSDGLTQPEERPVRAPEPINLKKEKKSQPEEPQIRDEDLLRQIRAANDAIADPVMSAKIDRIEQITRRILTCQKEHPERASQLRSFLNYYLPTTLKILNSYAEMANQGIEGENISAAKQRIEAMMDKVVEGFEKQLDKLYAGDLLDITSDITVMEKMMAKDGLAGADPFGTPPAAPKTSFGGAAFQTAPEAEKEVDPTDTWR